MARTTTALIVSGFESLLISILAFVLFGAFAASAADRSGITIWAYSMQFFILVATLLTHSICLGLQKADTIGEKTPALTEAVEKLSNELGPKGGSLHPREVARLATLVARSAYGVNYRDWVLIGTANAYCVAVFTILVVYEVVFLQSVEASFGNAAAWKEAVIGGDAQIVGTIVFGVATAYLVIVLLVSMYGAYTATPVGQSNLLFLEWRSLTILSGFVVFLPYTVEAWAACTPESADQYILLVPWVLLVCFEDIFLELLFSSCGINKIIRLILTIVMQLVPLIIAVAVWSSNTAVWGTVLGVTMLGMASAVAEWVFSKGPGPAEPASSIPRAVPVPSSVVAKSGNGDAIPLSRGRREGSTKGNLFHLTPSDMWSQNMGVPQYTPAGVLSPAPAPEKAHVL